MIRNSIPRLRSVRFKDGRAPLRVIRPAEDHSAYRDAFTQDANSIADARKADMAGYAIIAWSRCGASSVICATTGIPVAVALMPEFARSCVADWVHSQ